MPDHLASIAASASFITDTLTTTYVYYNTFSAAGGLPLVLSSTETVSNVMTHPAYLLLNSQLMEYGGLQPLHEHSTRITETETYYSTYTFSKTLLGPSYATPVVLTTKETVTQVVVTEALLPLKTLAPTPVPTSGPTATPIFIPNARDSDFITKTYLTTFTHLFTEMGGNGEMRIRSSTSVLAETVTERLPDDATEASMATAATTTLPTPLQLTTMFPSWLEERLPVQSPSFATIDVTKTLTPVLLYATKVYYTTYTYFTTVRQKGASGSSSSKVHSRTQVVSRVVTEALSTAFDRDYVEQLKSSYLSKHSVFIDVVSSVEEIIPGKTIELESGGPSVFHPHWPKGEDEVGVIEPESVKDELMMEVGEKMPSIQNKLQTPISSSEEHFDEVKEGVHKIVSVLTNTKSSGGMRPPSPPAVEPTRTLGNSYGVYSTESPVAPAAVQEEIVTDEAYAETVPLQEILKEDEKEEPSFLTETPVTHVPTPPLVLHSIPSLQTLPPSKYKVTLYM
jgi:hypothetical protein